jgi:hypothetical protein
MIGTGAFSEKEYRSISLNSYSSLKDFSVDRKKYHKKYIMKEKIKEKDTKASNMGRLVETLLMEPDKFDDLFFMSTCVKIPGGMLGDFIYKLSELISENTDDDGVLKGDFEDHAMEAYKASGFKIAFATVLKKLDEPENQLYYEECLKVNYYEMSMVTTQDVTNAEKIVEGLKEGLATSHIVNIEPSDTFDVYDQLKISDYTIDGMRLKSMLDKVIVNLKKKTIHIYDLKCTWSVENFFKEYYLYRRSYIQAFLYYHAVKHLTEVEGSTIEGFDIKLPAFIVCDSVNYYDPLVYQLTEKDMKEAYDGFEYQGKTYPGVGEIIANLQWAIENDVWGMSKTNYEQQGNIPLK